MIYSRAFSRLPIIFHSAWMNSARVEAPFFRFAMERFYCRTHAIYAEDTKFEIQIRIEHLPIECQSVFLCALHTYAAPFILI